MTARNTFEINGVIDTSNNVFDNIELLANSAGAFVTWDSTLGKWSVIANTTGTSVHSFDDSNIIGPITVGGLDINDLYNSVAIEYPHKDLRDTVDTVTLTVDAADRFDNELDNQLNIKLNTVNNPVQAQLIANIELKQNRVDKTIEFATDFTANGLKAGDLIDVTNTAYDFSAKVFRIIQITEDDADEGTIIYTITALEYDADVYSTAGLSYDLRTTNTGIKSQLINEEIEDSDDEDAGKQIGRLLLANLATKAMNKLVGKMFGDETAEGAFTEEQVKEANDNDAFLSSFALPTLTLSSDVTSVCEGGTITITLTDTCNICYFDVPDFAHPYTITGVQQSDIDVPLTGEITLSGGTATFVINTIDDSDPSTETLTFTVGSASVNVDIFVTPSQYVQSVTNGGAITEGGTATATVTTVGYNNGDTLPYTISGSASSKVTSPALTGTVSLTSNSATLNIVTSDDSAYNATESLTVQIGTATVNPCIVSSDSTTITVNNNDTTGPITPNVPKPGDYQCVYTSIPVVWCATFDPDTNRLKDINPKIYAYVPTVTSGGTPVPVTCSVTNPGQATAAVSIDSTVLVDTSPGLGGAQIDLITAFNTPPQGTGGYFVDGYIDSDYFEVDGAASVFLTGSTITTNGYFI